MTCAPLALSYTGDLQSLAPHAEEVLDYCALVRSFGDQYSGLLPDDSAEIIEGFSYAEAYEQLSRRHRPIVRRAIRYLRGSVRSLWS